MALGRGVACRKLWPWSWLQFVAVAMTDQQADHRFLQRSGATSSLDPLLPGPDSFR